MYIHTKKISENEDEVIYKFFNDISEEDGIFCLFKNKMSDDFKSSCELIRPIVTKESSEILYTRAIVSVYKSYRTNGFFPEASSFYGAG